MAAAAVLLGCTAVLGIVIGSTSVGIDDVLALAFGADAEQTAANVIWNIRLPRVLAALLAGAALAQAGALIQAALDNPLASPSIIGVNAGSGFFVLLAACTFPSAFGLAPVAAFLGARYAWRGSSLLWRALGARHASPSCSPAWRSRQSSLQA